MLNKGANIMVRFIEQLAQVPDVLIEQLAKVPGIL